VWGFLYCRIPYARVFELDHNHITHKEIWKVSTVTIFSFVLCFDLNLNLHFTLPQNIMVFSFAVSVPCVAKGVKATVHIYNVGTLSCLVTYFSPFLSIKSENVECSLLGLDNYHEKLAQELKIGKSLQLSDLLLINRYRLHHG
jgi:hypothetical protein